jgi:glutathione S-transferase
MKLFGGSGSPYVRKVRIVLAEKNLAHEHVVTGPASPEVTQANPLAKIPTFLCDDGKPLYDSSVIVEYLDGTGGAPKLIPEAFAERIDVKRWEALGDGIMDATVAISHEDRLPVAQRKDADWYAKQQKKIDGGLAAMEKDLGGKAFCKGDAFTLADVACGVALGYLDRALPNFDWRKGHPNLESFAQRMAERESFKTTLPAKA